MTGRWTRRRLLASASGAIAGLAGCLGDDSDGGSGGTDDDGSSDDGSGTGSNETEDSNGENGSEGGDTDGDADDSDGLDLREANVTAVAIEAEGDGAYRFDVTLYHDDDGEDGYANWWQVETLDGEQLGRRDLLHAHSTEPFTRSETVSVPEGESCVVVRGHDQTHGYGGQAMLVTIESGATRAERQGSEPSEFADASCP